MDDKSLSMFKSWNFTMTLDEARIIVEKYVDFFASGKNENPAFNKNWLPCSKQNILVAYKLYLSNLIRKKDLPKERYDGYINLLKFINHFYEYKDSIIINNAIEKNLVTPETKALMDEYGDNLFAQYEIDDLINFIDIIIKISPKHENEYSFYKKIYSIIGIKYKKGYEVLEN